MNYNSGSTLRKGDESRAEREVVCAGPKKENRGTAGTATEAVWEKRSHEEGVLGKNRLHNMHGTERPLIERIMKEEERSNPFTSRARAGNSAFDAAGLGESRGGSAKKKPHCQRYGKKGSLHGKTEQVPPSGGRPNNCCGLEGIKLTAGG